MHASLPIKQMRMFRGLKRLVLSLSPNGGWSACQTHVEAQVLLGGLLHHVLERLHLRVGHQPAHGE